MQLLEALVTGLVLYLVVNQCYQNWLINTHNNNQIKTMLYGRLYVNKFGKMVRFTTWIALVLVIIYWVWKWIN